MAAPSISLVQSMPLGGTISTMVTKVAAAPIRAAERWSALPSVAAGISRAVGTAASVRPGCVAAALLARAIARRWQTSWRGYGSALVPQQPPTNCTPALMNLRAKLAMYSGEAEVDIAAFDRARHAGVGHGDQRQSSWRARMRSMALSTVAGPGCNCSRWRRRPTRSVGPRLSRAWPSRQLASSSTVTMTRTAGRAPRLGLRSRAARPRSRRSWSQSRGGHATPGPLGERADLFGEGGAGFVEADFAQWLKADAERTDGAGDPGFCRPACLGYSVDAWRAISDAGEIDRADLVAQVVTLAGGRRSRRRCWSRGSPRRPAGTLRARRRPVSG